MWGFFFIKMSVKLGNMKVERKVEEQFLVSYIIGNFRSVLFKIVWEENKFGWRYEVFQ